MAHEGVGGCVGEGERRSDREEARTKSRRAGQFRSLPISHDMRRAHETQVTTGTGNTHGGESASGSATLRRAGGRGAAGRATPSVQTATSVGGRWGTHGVARRALSELTVPAAGAGNCAVGGGPPRRDENCQRNIHIPKKLKDTGAVDTQTRCKHDNAKGIGEEGRSKPTSWCSGWEEGRSVGGVGGRAKNCR
jgi:hypothetical protein